MVHSVYPLLLVVFTKEDMVTDHLHKQNLVTRAVRFESIASDRLLSLLEYPQTSVYAIFGADQKEVFLFSFDPNEMIQPFVEEEFLYKTKEEIQILRNMRCGPLAQPKTSVGFRTGGVNGTFHPLSAQETEVATILCAEILECIVLKNGHVVDRSDMRILRVEFKQLPGCKLFLFEFFPEEYYPKLHGADFVGLSLHRALALIDSRKVKVK